MALAVLLYLLALPITLAAEWWLLEKMDSPAISRYLIEHVMVPLLRVWLIWLFVLSAYPSIFGWDLAPSLEAIYAAGFELSRLINLLFLLGLVLPLLPFANNLPSVLVPIQALIACHWLVYWAIVTTGNRVAVFPDMSMLVTFFLISLAGYGLAKVATRWTPDHLNHLRTEIFDLIILLTQLPAILIYARDLGGKIKFVAG